MGTGMVKPERLELYCGRAAKAASGDFAELGCYAGRTTSVLCKLGKQHARMVHAIDSFRGMAEPGPNDGENYPAGNFDVGGLDGFAKLMSAKGLVLGQDYKAHAGYVPEVLYWADPELTTLRLSFAYLDLDHYEPTLHALRWLWEHMNPGGVILCDDYDAPDGPHVLAALALREWLGAKGEALHWDELSDDQVVIFR